MSGRLQSVIQSIAVSANLAPTVHNTQPVNWYADGDTLWLLADRQRFLTAADPEERDAGYSVGTALEGTVLALSSHNLAAVHVQELHGQAVESPVHGFVAMARITVKEDNSMADPLSRFVTQRHTCRMGFLPIDTSSSRQLMSLCTSRNDVAIINRLDERERLSRLNDNASVRFMRNRPYRTELLDWMRLSDNHPYLLVDGLSKKALAMSTLDALGARVLLGTRCFDMVDHLGLTQVLISEHKATMSASAIICLHRPREESSVSSGRALYRLWLSLTALGLSAWPMASVVDDSEAHTKLSNWQSLDSSRRWIAALRVGLSPTKFNPHRVRRAAEKLVLLR